MSAPSSTCPLPRTRATLVAARGPSRRRAQAPTVAPADLAHGFVSDSWRSLLRVGRLGGLGRAPSPPRQLHESRTRAPLALQCQQSRPVGQEAVGRAVGAGAAS